MSPVKDGQIVKDTVVCRSGGTPPAGGLTRTQVQVTHRRFPILGRILPFLFSREMRNEQVMESYVLLTPRVVDLQAAVDPAEIERRIETRPPGSGAIAVTDATRDDFPILLSASWRVQLGHPIRLPLVVSRARAGVAGPVDAGGDDRGLRAVGLLVLAMALLRSAPRAVIAPLAWVSFTWVGLAFLLLVLFLVTEPLRPAARPLVNSGLLGPGLAPGLAAGRFISRAAAAILVLLLGSLLAIIGVFSAPAASGARSHRAGDHRQLAPGTAGYTIVQLRHPRRGDDRPRVRGALRAPGQRGRTGHGGDHGDLVDGSVGQLATHYLLARNSAPATARVVRDRAPCNTTPASRTGWRRCAASGSGCCGTSMSGWAGSTGSDLAGTDDYTSGHFAGQHGQDLALALAGRDPSSPLVLLVHQPRTFPEAITRASTSSSPGIPTAVRSTRSTTSRPRSRSTWPASTGGGVRSSSSPAGSATGARRCGSSRRRRSSGS